MPQLKRTCSTCEHTWLVSRDMEALLTREAVRGHPRKKGLDLLNLDLSQLVQRRVKATLTDVALGDSVAAQELKLSRSCPNCKTYLQYTETEVDPTEALASLVSLVPEENRVEQLLSELDLLFEDLQKKRITPAEFTRRQEQLLQS
ncbi:hypothetical protein [Deinococcus cellulosilyticus]|uniref:Uncharacterized protein n=1 Tax=Deinococcus cellulosilyticus (strain DSM 18568 / NBRC 106333 / KACC 11606 / 5516J-15) TaxID=1223518 RepID=A0A511N258_DEIC1|nr:hypothetical protein [Deinococcus cellulosilyticus]GEM46940.1 hypothetical protein DC3_25750 [Deinococcus cellulosilyticus NBRC 106333 = KACC 11606]